MTARRAAPHDVPLDGVHLLTSDVFDTALARVVGQPASAFLLLGQRLRALGCWTAGPGAFAVQRAQAEVSARAATGREPTLEDIYAELAGGPFLADAGQARGEELALEAALVVPLPAHGALLERARAAGVRVCFVSDTYLSSDALRAFLGPLARDGERIYASCEHAASKRDGDLFPRVLELEGEAAAHVLHVGDHPRADGAMARRSGLAAHLGPEPALNRYEAGLERHAVATDGAASLLAGASRVVRTTREVPDRVRPLVDVAAGVAAPVLIGFVAWALRTARDAGCDRLSFVARDGQVLHAIASRLEAHRPAGDRVRLVYTHGGRRVWHPAGLTPAALAAGPPGWWLGEGMPPGAGWQAPLDMLALDEADVPPGVVQALRQVADRPAAEREVRLWDLWQHAEVQSLLAGVGRERRRLAARYLRDSGLGQGRWAMVDVGWRGRSAVSINRTLVAEGLTRPLHLYLGLLRPEPELTRTGDWATYLFCRPGPDGEAGGYGGGLYSFLEVACSADHGPVRGFREGPDGAVTPVLDPPDEAARAWGVGEVQATILDVADRVAPFVDELRGADLRPALKDLLRCFLEVPDPAEVRAWGTFPYAADPAGAAPEPWVTPWSQRDTLRWALRGDQPRSFWPQASLATSPWPGRALVRARQRLGARARRRR